MAIVNYPSSIKTDKQKLGAIYSLLEQMRLEHNRQGDIACNDWKKNKDRWPLYQKLYHEKVKWIIDEENQLKEKIRLAAYPKIEDWEKVADEQELHNLNILLYGNPNEYYSRTTKATSPGLDELKAINLNRIGVQEASDPTEDLTTYIEVDPGTHITKTADRVTFASIDSSEDAYLYKDHEVDHFNGDFEHYLEGYLSAMSSSWLQFGIHGMANDIGSITELWWDSKSLIYANFTLNGDPEIMTWESDAGTRYWGSFVTISYDTQYYLTAKRDEAVGTYGTYYLYIYTDANRTNQVAGSPSSIALHGSKKDFRYLYTYWGYGSEAGTASGWMQYFDLQEEEAVSFMPRHDAYDGYRCFIEQYVKNKVRDVTPFKLPDGTKW